MSQSKIELFVKLVLQIQSFYDEISTMAKKAPDGLLNKFKLKFVNHTLTEINNILTVDKPFNDFDNFDEDSLPTNSDVTLILSQYLKSCAKLYNQHTRIYGGTRYLLEDGQISRIVVERLEVLESVYK